MNDGRGKWWDVWETPKDLISIRQITDWKSEPKETREERQRLLKVIKPFDLHGVEHDAPGTPPSENTTKNNKRQQ